METETTELKAKQPRAFKPAVAEEQVVAILSDLKVKGAVKIGNDELTYFNEKKFRMKLLSSGLIKIVQKANVKNRAVTHVSNLIYFDTLDSAD